MIKYFSQYDENGNIIKTIAAKNIEWCIENIGGEWLEVTEFINSGKTPIINTVHKCAYDPFSNIVTPEPARDHRAHAVWLALPKDDNHLMAQACTTKDYMTLPPMIVWQNSYPLAEQYIKAESEGVFPDVVLHKVIIDSAPQFTVVLNVISSGKFNMSAEAMINHPHISAPTIHELLRVVYEWYWAYNELGSREPAAELCHTVWQTLNPTEEVVEAIKTLPDMAIAKFISGDTNAQEPLSYDPPCPYEIISWWQEKIIEFSPSNKNNFNDLGLVFTPVDL